MLVTCTGKSAQLEGSGFVDRDDPVTYKVDVTDNGESGRTDTFAIRLSNGKTAVGTLTRGNVQVKAGEPAARERAPPRSGALLAVLLLASALALPGRGGGGPAQLSKREYERQVRSAYGDVQAAFSGLRPGAGDLAARLADAATTLNVAAASLASIRPPGDVANEPARLVAGLDAYAADVARLRADLAEGDQQALAAFNARIPTSEPIELMAEAAEAMKFKGYDLGRIAED